MNSRIDYEETQQIVTLQNNKCDFIAILEIILTIHIQ